MACERILKEVRFDDRGLVPAVVQDADGTVLMLAYMNAEALEKTLESGQMHYWSRSRGKLWTKGEVSGHVQTVREVRIDCDGDALLFRVDQKDAACHQGYYSCFFRKRQGDGFSVSERRVFDPRSVYR